MQQVNVATIAAKYKCRSLLLFLIFPLLAKYEIHFFLSVDCAKYLPSLDCVTIYWMKSLIEGTKKCIDGSQIVHLGK